MCVLLYLSVCIWMLVYIWGGGGCLICPIVRQSPPIKSPIRAEGEGILLSEVRAINSLAERSEGYYMPCKREGRSREIPLQISIYTAKYVQISVNIAKYPYKYPQIPLYLPPFSPLASKYIQNTAKSNPPPPLSHL